MAVPGAQVVAEDTPDGEAVTFTTMSPDAVPELRARIHAMADRYERRLASQAMQDGSSGGEAGSAGSGGSGAPSPAPAPARSSAVVEDVEGGSRILITPNDPSELEQVRASIQARVARMQETGSCDMGHGHGEPNAQSEGSQ